MIKGQTSIREGIEDFMHPCTDMYITQGAGGNYSHKGTMANDIRGLKSGVRFPYYAPCTCKCIWANKKSGEAIWQSISKVRFANGRIDYATFCTVHDDSFNAKKGQIVNQGQQLGNMGKAGQATGVHLHFEVSQSKLNGYHKNQYGIYCFYNEYDIDDTCFMDNTNILNMKNANWKYLKDVPVVKEWTKGTYKMLNAKYIRSSASLGNNIVRVKNTTTAMRSALTSTNQNALAKVKAGTTLTAIEFITGNDGRVYLKNYSGYIVAQNNDGTKNVEKID